jgi:membrane fusion protein (multidrug efflux system)
MRLFTKRTGTVLLFGAASVLLLGTVKARQIQTMMAQAASFQPPPEAVTTVVARAERWPSRLAAIGTVKAERGVTLSADLPGVVEAIRFESGRAVRAGEVLVELDTRQERAQLAAAEAQRELARVNFERVSGLVGQGIVAQAELDRTSAEHKQAEARAGEIRATIERKQIRAPFAGVLGIRQVNLGQYLNAGDPIVSLQALDPIHVDFSVPQQQLGEVAVGRDVQVSVAQSGAAFKGRVTAVDAVVDQATRNLQVRATFANPTAALRPGMFVEAQVVTGDGRSVLVLPASAISYAPYGDSVFVVAEAKGANGQAAKVVSQQFVKLGEARGDQVAVLSGVEQGAEVVSSGAFKLRSGAPVQVNNEVQPSNEAHPKPEDN